ncbi:deoxynucleoside kinase-like [Sitodiplosis mosellana]|uniref:deoxynucleoside kinase-like n=1 Tax=Sitodiplosis mosellana TaxID=263140 RepID=UPI002444B0DE|nr:deoxynucleoside kinase-like [Sitodiplosis mosellana]
MLTSFPSVVAKKPFTLVVEGNIGSGKSTLLNYFNKFTNIDILPEPVEKWSNFEGVNLLDLMFKNRNEWFVPFQSYVALTMLQNHSRTTDKNYKIMERSIYSITNSPTEVDLFIYLRTSPEIALNRMRKRDREEENGVSLEYLKILHELHARG